MIIGAFLFFPASIFLAASENNSDESSSSALAPTGLLTDLLDQTETVWRHGFPTPMTLDDLRSSTERVQFAAILSLRPTFSWIVNDSQRDALQTAYEIDVFSESGLANVDRKSGDVWASGRVESGKSSSVPFGGDKIGRKSDVASLAEDSVYAWRVRTWNNHGEVSPWSSVKKFKTGTGIGDSGVSYYPSVFETDSPVLTTEIDPRTRFYDFGRASFGQAVVRITLRETGAEAGNSPTTAIVRLGERIKEGRVDQKPAGSTRYAEYSLPLLPGTHDYSIETRIDPKNSTGAAVLVPDYLGEVMPFRYAEIEISDSERATAEGIARRSAFYPFDDKAAAFTSSDSRLNDVWELCRYSIKATSFTGYYIDGDRERIPYEGDALLNQLSHYSTDREFSMARRTQEYLIFHPTWPTEWILQSVQMAWYDYLFTGDPRHIEKYYDQLRAKSLLDLAEDNGLISTRRGKLSPEVIESVHFKGKGIRDIVDWPHQGLAGNDNAKSGETDGFVFNDFNAVVNAYHYFALRSMTRFAEILDKKDDAAFYRERLEKVKSAYQTVFFDPTRGVYKDGNATKHASLHANMFALAFGLVPDNKKESVAAFVRSRGVKCSVYGAQFLLDAVYEGNDGAYGFERMTDEGLRGWLNMIRAGSTISMEAWDDRYKPNQDWNHAWGAAPANIIPRKLLGVEPLLPAFEKVRIKPQVAELAEAVGRVPTIRGEIDVAVNQTDGAWRLTVTIPANMTSEIFVPAIGDGDRLTVIEGDAEKSLRERYPETIRDGGYWKIPAVGSGTRTFVRRP